MAQHVLRRSADDPEKTALSVLGRDHAQHWSYGEVASAVRGIATGFVQRGLTPGGVVLLRLGNTPDFPFAYLAAISVGLIPVPSSAQLTLSETEAVIAELNPALILHQAGVPCPDHPNRLDVSALEDMRALPPAEFELGDPDRPGYIVYTSGTSGSPRAVVHAHRAIWARQMMVDGWYGLRREDRLLHAGAFNWTYTLGTGVMDPWTIGATALIPEPGLAPEDLPDLLRQHQATIFAAAPGVYRKMLQGGASMDLPALRHGLAAGEKLSGAIRQSWEAKTGTAIYEAYGMSECSTFISGSPDHPALDGALGQPQQGRRIAILGADGPVPRGEEGVIAVHKSDPGLMLEYLGAPEETKARFQGDWFLTGDQGAMGADDQIQYLGRAR